MQWGFTGFDSKLLINARSETAQTKPTFKKPMLEHRCLVPASGYYEWQKVDNSKAKTKYRFFNPESLLYLAGCYRKEQNSLLHRFVILTQTATPEFASIHNRMPVIVAPNQVKLWLQNGQSPTESSADLVAIRAN
jgi:putative SOS response-associated peptidase YedK